MNILADITNKAAREMKMRVANMVGPMAEQVWLGTFHALAARMLRQSCDLVGYGLILPFSMLMTRQGC